MSIPRILGYTDFERRTSLADGWSLPAGCPDDLWPQDRLVDITPMPSGWVTLEQFERDEGHETLRGCLLIPNDATHEALAGGDWIGDSLGDFTTWESFPDHQRGYETGLAATKGALQTEWFLHARQSLGATRPQIEVSLPFLWYWDAFRTTTGWNYIDAAGREQQLLQFECSEDHWRVSARVEELRTYLNCCGKCAVIYVRLTTTTDKQEFERVEDAHRSGWAHFQFFATSETLSARPESFSMVTGNYILQGAPTAKRRRCDDFTPPPGFSYQEFIHDIDAQSGVPLMHTCNPDELGTYFDADDSKLHYLTPIYFRRKVLSEYLAEPSRYQVSRNRLSCMNLWGVDLSINSAGLVEVYLGDIGTKIPYQDWGHWRSHNVPPEGQTDEGRFRRDFLNQFAESPDPVRDLKLAREAANAAAQATLGGDLWRKLPHETELAYQSLMGPMTDDPSALETPLLILSKVLVDALDSKLLKKSVPDARADEKSLSLLKRLLENLGDSTDCTKILKELYAVRSRGGIAHLENSTSAQALADLGIAGPPLMPAFERLVARLAACLVAVGGILTQEASNSEPMPSTQRTTASAPRQ